MGGATRYDVAGNLARIIADAAGETTHVIVARVSTRRRPTRWPRRAGGVYHAPVLAVRERRGLEAKIPAGDDERHQVPRTPRRATPDHRPHGRRYASVPDWVRSNSTRCPRRSAEVTDRELDRYTNSVAIAAKVRTCSREAARLPSAACFITNGETSEVVLQRAGGVAGRGRPALPDPAHARDSAGIVRGEDRGEQLLDALRRRLLQAVASSLLTYHDATRSGTRRPGACGRLDATTAVANGWGLDTSTLGVATSCPTA